MFSGSPRTSLFPVLLVLIAGEYCNASDLGTNFAIATPQNLYQRDYSKEGAGKITQYTKAETTECMDRCNDLYASELKSKTVYVPLCGWVKEPITGDEEQVTDDVKNAVSCTCTDKKYVAQKFDCLIKECGRNSSGIDVSLNIHYANCMLYSDVVYPKPEGFFNELCLLNDMPEGYSFPTNLSWVEEMWPDYTFADEWPEHTATTPPPRATGVLDDQQYLASNKPNWTCVPTALPEQAGDTDGKEEENTNGETTKKNGGTSSSAGIMGMAVTAVVSVVMSVTIFM